jgi:hypothetical protein
MTASQPSKLLVDESDDLVERARIPLPPGEQQVGDFRRGGVPHERFQSRFYASGCGSS